MIYNSGNTEPETDRRASNTTCRSSGTSQPQSILSAAVFYKDIKDFVTSVTTNEIIQNQNFQVVSVVNGDSREDQGRGDRWVSTFSITGFGVVANWATTSSTAHLGDVTGGLEGVIPHSYNF